MSKSSEHYLAGKRVQLHPSTDAWMMGDRYGQVQRVTKGKHGYDIAHVLMDRSNKVRRVPVDLLEQI
jgi:hypothetical protein